MASAGKRITFAFDLYGTLLSTSSISASLAEILGISSEKADSISAQWRVYQLEYSWRATCMQKGGKVSFRELTRAALLHALSEGGISLPAGAISGDKEEDENTVIFRLMKAYDGLSAFPDVAKGLKMLAEEKQSRASDKAVRAVVFSNGTTEAIRKAVAEAKMDDDNGPDSAVKNSFDGVVSVMPTGEFKPAPAAYRHLFSSVGAEEENEGEVEVWLVSSNPFDIVGALGRDDPRLKAVWVDRAGKGWMDRLGTVMGVAEPTIIAKGVDDAIRKVLDI